jgi:DNA-binding HxlR family transcriptional regulator
MSKKGFYWTLQYIGDKGEVHYNEVLKHAHSDKIVRSRSQITVILNALTDLGLLKRNVSVNRPVRTTYTLSDKGKELTQLFKKIEELSRKS